MEKYSALLALCAGNSPVAGEFPPQMPVTQSLIFPLIYNWINGWVNTRDAGDLRRHRAHYDVMWFICGIVYHQSRLLWKWTRTVKPHHPIAGWPKRNIESTWLREVRPCNWIYTFSFTNVQTYTHACAHMYTTHNAYIYIYIYWLWSNTDQYFISWVIEEQMTFVSSEAFYFFMMMSSNENILRVTGPLCGEFTGHRWIPLQRPVTRIFGVFFDLRLNKRLCK